MAARIVPTPGVSPDGWVSLGVIARAHGIKGVLKLHLWNEESEVLGPGLEVQLGSAAGWRVHRVTSYASGLLQLEGVSDRNAAEALQGKELRVRRADFPEDEEGTWLVDLVGARVEDDRGGLLGEVVGFSDNGAQELLEVRTPGGQDVLVPFVEPIVRAVERGAEAPSGRARVVLRPPGGLFDEDAVIDEPEGGADAEDAAKSDATDDAKDHGAS